MQNFVFFPINNSPFIQQYKEKLLKLPEFSKANDSSFPISIMNNSFFNIDQIISNIFDVKSVNEIPEIVSIIMEAPDELIDFSCVDFTSLPSLNLIQTIFNQEMESAHSFGLEELEESTFLKKIQMILPLFLRSSIDEISKNEFYQHVEFMLKAFPNHPITDILRILIYAKLILMSKNPSEIKFNLENSLIKINSLIRSLYKGDNKDILINTFPYLLPKVTEIVCATAMYSFDCDNNSSPTKYDLINQICQFFILVAINYPPSFEKVGWSTFSKYFSHIGPNKTIETRTYPDYLFVAENPHLVTPNVVCCCVTDLLNGFNVLSHLSEDFSERKKKQIYSVLIKLSHENQSFARSLSRSLINLGTFPFYRSAFDSFKQDLGSSESENLAAVLYDLMTSYNFSDEFVKFELEHKLTKLILMKTDNEGQEQLKHLAGFHRIVAFDTKGVASIFEAAHLVNAIGVALCDANDCGKLAEISLILHQNEFEKFIEKTLKDYFLNKTYLDYKFTQPFIVLASRYIQLKSAMLSIYPHHFLGLNVDFILTLYHSMLLAAPALNTRKQLFTSLSGDLYFYRSVISRSINPRFIQIAGEFVRSKKMSLIEPFVFFISDYLTFNSFNADFYSDLLENNNTFLYLVDNVLLTDSLIVLHSVINLIVRLCENLKPEVLNKLFNRIFSLFISNVRKGKKNEYKEATKIAFILREISSNPKGKMSIIFNSGVKEFCDSVINCLNRDIVSKKESFSIMILEMLMNLLSPAITLNRNIDFVLRCGSELLPLFYAENIIASVCYLLKTENINQINDKVSIAAIRLLRYSCENPFIVKMLKDVPEFKLNINDLEKNCKVFQKPEFYVMLLQLAHTIAKVDSDFAFELIGLAEESTILCKPKLKKEKITGEIYNLSKYDVIINDYPKYSSAAIQKFYNKLKDKYNADKYEVFSSPFPPYSTTDYLDELPKDVYEEYVEYNFIKK